MRVTARNMVAHQNRKEKRASGACARCTRPNCDLALEASLRAKELSERPERSEGRERITRRGVPLSDNWLVRPIYTIYILKCVTCRGGVAPTTDFLQSFPYSNPVFFR